jgi:hypothetical protein
MTGADPAGSRFYDWVLSGERSGSFELRGDSRVVAQLQFEPKPGFVWDFKDPQAARATAGDRHWRFTVSRRGVAGFFGWAATVKITGDNHGEIALTGAVSQGQLRVDGRRTFDWRGKPIRGATSVFSLPDGQATPVALFRTGSPLQSVTTRVEITRTGSTLDEWPLLAALGVYLRMLMNRTWR